MLKGTLIAAIVCVCAAVFIIAFASFIKKVPALNNSYNSFINTFNSIEEKITETGSRALTVVVIFLLYLLRATTFVYPYPIIFLAAAVVLGPIPAFFVNLTGMLFIAMFRYFTGLQQEEGYLQKLMQRYASVNTLFSHYGKPSPAVCFCLRMVPFFPYNTISQLYGNLSYPFVKYMALTAVAIAPRLIVYSFIGNGVYDPLSSRFVIPGAGLLILTAVSLFTLRGMLQIDFKINSTGIKTEYGPYYTGDGKEI